MVDILLIDIDAKFVEFKEYERVFMRECKLLYLKVKPE